MTKTTILITILLFLTGCHQTTEPEFQPKLVINAELKAGNRIDSIFVGWTADITERFETGAQRASGAVVKINGIQLEEYDDIAGAYYMPDSNFRVQSGQTYNLEVVADGEQAISSTTVPPPFHFIPQGVEEGDTVQYVPGNSWFSEAFFTLSWAQYPGAPVYRVVSDADTANERTFIEDDRDEANVFKGEEEDRTDPTMWWVGDDFARINWMYFNYTGWHNLIVSAMDENYYRYRSGLNFNQFNGQNFNQIIQNGYGLFVSSASDTIRIFLVE